MGQEVEEVEQYLLEALDGNRFQELCLPLVKRTHPRLTSLPTGESDGGFDGFILGMDGRKEFALQAKWTRSPPANRVTWLKSALAKEKPKVIGMIAEGLKEWLLVTNVRGTAKPNVGTIDLVNQYLLDLAAELDIKVTVWWRNDVCTELDLAPWDLKRTYPEILLGEDLIRAGRENQADEQDRQRLRTAFRTAAAERFGADQLDTFTLGDVEGVPLDRLFVDVPVIGIEADADDGGAAPQSSLRIALGGARLPHIVMYGSPGQGKSALVQYLCQLHRGTVTQANVHLIDDASRAVLVQNPKIPIRIQLTDYAQWLKGYDPTSRIAQTPRPAGRVESLESFAAFLVTQHSGGMMVSNDDLIVFSRSTPLLFALDGLDEVADAKLKADVVAQIDSLARRASPGTSILVTSRPGPLGDAAPNPELFSSYSLEPLGETHWPEYVANWARAHALNPTDTAYLSARFKEIRQKSYIGGLATNPMQLAILLALLFPKNDEMVPSTRTTLFALYTSKLLEREEDRSAEGTEVVKGAKHGSDAVSAGHRQDVEAIAAYLGWHLHLRASNGEIARITDSDLKRLVVERLIVTARDRTKIDQLADDVTQRLWALSRLPNGVFEFELESMQEYLAARHLFNTAPRSTFPEEESAHLMRYGELLDRPFWQNVTRFMAGMFTRTETPALAQEMIEFVLKSDSKSWSRGLTQMLIEDGIFDHHPRVREDLTRIAYDDLGVIMAAAGVTGQQPRYAGTRLSKATANFLRAEITAAPHDSLAPYRAALLRTPHDAAAELALRQWWAHNVRVAEDLETARAWIRLSALPGVGGDPLPTETSDALYRRFPELADDLLWAGAEVEPSSALEDEQLRLVVSGRAHHGLGNSLAAALAEICSPQYLSSRFETSVHTETGRGGRAVPVRSGSVLERGDAALEQLRTRGDFGASVVEAVEFEPVEADRTMPWARLAAAITTQCGQSWLASRVAIHGVQESRSTAQTVPSDEGEGAVAFGENSHPVAMMRAVARNSGDAAWWRARATVLERETDQSIFVLALLSCAPISTLADCLNLIDNILADLPPEWIETIAGAFSNLEPFEPTGVPEAFWAAARPRSSALKALLLFRFPRPARWHVTSAEVSEIAQQPTLKRRLIETIWSTISASSQIPPDTVRALEIGGPHALLTTKDATVAPEIADDILSRPRDFPFAMIDVADQPPALLGRSTLEQISQGWFQTEPIT